MLLFALEVPTLIVYVPESTTHWYESSSQCKKVSATSTGSLSSVLCPGSTDLAVAKLARTFFGRSFLLAVGVLFLPA